MIDRIEDLEELLLATLDAVSRYRVGQREAVGAALDAGALLSKAKGRFHHGEWGDWLHRVGLAQRTASTWMKLAGLDLTTEEVIDRGGINAAARFFCLNYSLECSLKGHPGVTNSPMRALVLWVSESFPNCTKSFSSI